MLNGGFEMFRFPRFWGMDGKTFGPESVWSVCFPFFIFIPFRFPFNLSLSLARVSVVWLERKRWKEFQFHISCTHILLPSFFFLLLCCSSAGGLVCFVLMLTRGGGRGGKGSSIKKTKKSVHVTGPWCSVYKVDGSIDDDGGGGVREFASVSAVCCSVSVPGPGKSSSS